MSDMTLEKAKEILDTADPLDCGWDIADARMFLEGYRAGLKKAAEIAHDQHYIFRAVEEIEKLAEEAK